MSTLSGSVLEDLDELSNHIAIKAMNTPTEGAGRSGWQRIDEVCDRFETAKRAGEDPRVVDFLSEAASPDERELLLRELIQLELDLAVELGSTIDIQHYVNQLPDDEDLIRTSFRRHRNRTRTGSTSTSVEPQLIPGQTFGSYTIIDQLGEGGMGHVYHARHVTMDRDVALKVLSPKLIDSDEAVARFHREIKAAAKLHHPNIVTAHDAGEQDGLHFLVMEYVDGRDLSLLVKAKGPLSLSQSIQCIIQAATGLAYAHEKNIIHRDIKPSNLLVDRDGNIKVLDMGLARFEMESEEQELTSLTGTGVLMGTVDYMAPEQSLDTRTADARSDIYSLGCTFWYLLTGKSIYGGDTVMKKLLAHREDEIPSLRQMVSDVPETVDAVFRNMVAKDKDDRYQSMQEVIDALQSCLPDHSVKDTSLSMTVDPKLAGFFAGHAAETGSTSVVLEASQSIASPHEATVLVDDNQDSTSETSSVSSGKLPKWLFGTAVAVIGLIVAALLIPGSLQHPDEPVQNTENLLKNVVGSPDHGSADVGKVSTSPGNFALEFQSRDHVVFPTFPQKFDGPLTVEFWFTLRELRQANKTGRTGRFFQMPGFQLLDAGSEPGYLVPQFYVDEAAWFTANPSVEIKVGQQVHVAITVGENQFDYFIDGHLQKDVHYHDSSAVVNRKLSLPTKFKWYNEWDKTFTIGPSQDRYGDMTPGMMHELRISNTVRYEGDFTPQKRFTPDEHTVALYHFDQGEGNALRDSSGNGYHGVIAGAEWVRLSEGTSSEPRVTEDFAHTMTLEFSQRDHVTFPTFPKSSDGPLTIEFWFTPFESEKRTKAGMFFQSPSLQLINLRGTLPRLAPQFHVTEYHSFMAFPEPLINTGEPVHVAIGAGMDVFDYYLNGSRQPDVWFQTDEAVEESKTSENLPTTFQPHDKWSPGFMIGPLVSQHGDMTPGRFHELRISNTIRYRENFTPQLRFIPDEHTVALYHFDQGQGNTLKDYSGNGYHGVIEGAEWVRFGEKSSSEASVTEDIANAMALEFKERDHIAFPTLPENINTPFTIEWWFQPTELKNGSVPVSLSGVFLQLKRQASGYRWIPWMFVSDVESIIQKSLAPVSAQVPTHFAIVVDQNRLDFYVNGLTQGEKLYQNQEHSMSWTNLPEKFVNHARHDPRLRIGPLYEGHEEMSPGKMFELRISNTARYVHDFTPQKRFSPDEHTVALYHFDQGEGNTLKDYSGNGYHGVIEGAEWVRLGENNSTTPPVTSNHALQFDGQDDYVEIPSLKISGNEPCTIEVRVRDLSKPDEADDIQSILRSEGLGLEHQSELWKAVATGESLYLIHHQYTSKRAIDVALVYDGDTVAIFVDGKRSEKPLTTWSQDLGTQIVDTLEKPFQIKDGQRVTLGSELGGRHKLHGVLDELRISNTIRYTDDYTPADRLDVDEHTLALYHFDNGQGDVLKDTSGNNHHGTIHGATWVRVDRDLNAIEDNFSAP